MIKPVTIIAKNRVPFYEFLNSYIWLDSYLKCQNLKTQLVKLRSKESQISQMPCDPKDVMDNLSKSWEDHKLRQLEMLKTFIARNWGHPDLIHCFVSECEAPYSELKTIQVPDLELFEIAVKQSKPCAETIRNRKREPALNKIAEELASLKVEIATVSPANFFMRSKHGIILDIRETFVDFWENLQEQVSAPCGPRGMSLKHSEFAEQQAYKMLGIERYINADAQFSPNE